MSVAAVAFNQLLVRLKGATPISLAHFDKLSQLKQLGEPNELPDEAALFVTWTLDGDLRGCIGTFSPGPIEATVRKYSEIAAFEDPRFPPIRANELPHLAVGVTLLGELEPCGLNDWEIGKHGVKATFPGGLDSTFLPEVAEEQGWDHQETLQQLAAKAGARSTQGMKLWRYPGYKSRISYKDYTSLG